MDLETLLTTGHTKEVAEFLISLDERLKKLEGQLRNNKKETHDQSKTESKDKTHGR